MSLADHLASALKRHDEKPNVELAQRLAKQAEVSSEVLELLAIVKNGEKAQAHDAIKVLYELAALRPGAFGDKIGFVFDLLGTKDNRILWGALTLLANTCKLDHGATFEHLPQILDASARGSVIAKDATCEILLELAASSAHQNQVHPHLINFLSAAAPNQLPMYAENAAKRFINTENVELVHTLFARLEEMPTAAKRARLEKAIAKLSLPPKPLSLA
ncbi:hypothetical protein [Maritalea porphyrae]|jgi:hypothetical protein|uniref:hypothetical protein n=1 Tax=Maritalea porphyrae TaxID=880732 RepID=UPI0022AED122|nr:hypothetical protein [Maritalea porphyrae]MCZ4272421.1 hypothetical protein [Maritalea porphyrae]